MNAVAEPIKPAIQLPGSKVRMAQTIVGLLGQSHDSYIEPYLGSAAVLLAKAPVKIELVNDINGELINFYRVLRDEETRDHLIEALAYTPYSRAELEMANSDDPDGFIPGKVERARRFVVRANQIYVGGGGTTQWVATMRPSSNHSNATKWNNYRERLPKIAERLKNVQIEHRDAIEVLEAAVRQDDAGIAVYLDPPYPTSTRRGSSYRTEMTDSQHMSMLKLAVKLPGPSVISTYPNEMYESVLAPEGWQQHHPFVQRRANSSAGKGSTAVRTEVLWANRATTAQHPLELEIT